MDDTGIEPGSDGKATKIILVVMAVLFSWYLIADRFTPYTASARVKLYVLAVVPDVSGYVANIPIRKNQMVQAGDVLLQIETSRFEIEVEAAEAALEAAGQRVGAGTAQVSVATAALVKAQARLKEVRAQAGRILTLEEKGIYARARGDQARAGIATAEAEVAAKQAELESAKESLGKVGLDNPQVRLALADLTEAQLNLERSTYRSPAKAIVSGLEIDEGAYAAAGQPLMTLIGADDIWVEAFMTENNLGRIEPGDRVELAFDAFPGRIFAGEVKSTSFGVSTGKAVNLGQLATAEQSGSWLRDPQRFSVIINTTDYDYTDDTTKAGLRYNSQVDVIVYTGNNFVWNLLGAIWIRIVSLFSYLY
jgi:multidrug resistance efflux pump